MEKDSDSDGLVDGVEIALGFDYQASDSDGDGLTDYEEYNITITNPLKIDTDENGIEDGEDDIDGEGISNSEELKIGTNPLQADTDNDNLTDYEEIYVYGTNPILKDTDEDGLIDYDDVILGFSPLLKDTDNNGVIDSEEKIDQIVTKQFEDVHDGAVTDVSVSLNTNGNAQDSVIIENVYGVDQLSSSVVGLIGVPVDINCKVEFERAEMVFYYDENMLRDTKEENLAILWYDEENNWYQILDEDSVIDTENNTVTYVTTHFSTYMLVDKEEWYNAWRENIDYRNSTFEDAEKNYFDIAFVVDVSGSMSGSRISSAQTAINNFVDAMQYEDEAAIIKFNSYAYSVCDFSSDKDMLKKGVNSLRASGGTNVNRGLLKAIEVFDSHECNKQKILILLCDGDVNYMQSTIDMCVSRNIQIYAVNVASSTAHASLEKMAYLTGGQYYYGYSADMLETIFSTIESDTLEQIDTTDTDRDGLYDIYENAGMKLPNGQIIYTDPNRQDTDEDNLTDLQETGLVYNIDDRYIGKGEHANIKYFQLRSDPTKEDSDDDGIMDAEDKKPFEQDIVLVAQLDNRYSGFEYLNIKVSEGKTVSGGDQTWWLEKSQHKSDEGGIDCVEKIMEDKNYRLKKYGCGVIAMCDMELYLKQQNEDNSYGIPSLLMPFEGSTGVCPKDKYMNYVDYLYDTKYTIGADVVNNVFKGIKSWTMEIGMNDFLRNEVDDTSYAMWGIYRHLPFKLHKESVLCNIEKMLKDNILVVFSYCSFGDDEDKLTLYVSEVSAKEKWDIGDYAQVKQHYMTIIGLSKYYEEETQNPKYILKVVSWGNTYYINYDEYAEKLSYFSNILSVH